MLIGLVGKPSSGKSTFFKAATLAEVEISVRPFTTIKKNEGVAFVRVSCAEKKFGVKCTPRHGFCFNGERFVPIKLMDVAGLIRGAHLGKGLGTAFLDDLRQADVLIHIVDAAGATNEKGEPVTAGSYDPVNDVRFLVEEIDAWFLGILKSGWQKFSRQVSQEKQKVDEAIANQFSGLKINKNMVKKAMRQLNLEKTLMEWSDEELAKFASELRSASKPIIIAANKVDIPQAKAHIGKLKKEFPKEMIIPCSAESELALRGAAKSKLIEYVPGDKDFKILEEGKLSEKQKSALHLIKSRVLANWSKTGVQGCLNSAVFEFLKYFVVYPVENASKLTDKKGNVLPDALLLPARSTAIDMAYAVHSDIGDKFVRAVDAKTKKIVGRDHELKNGDVLEIIAKK